MLSILVSHMLFCQFLSILVNFRQFSSILVNFCHFLSILANSCQFMLILVHSCHFMSSHTIFKHFKNINQTKNLISRHLSIKHNSRASYLHQFVTFISIQALFVTFLRFVQHQQQSNFKDRSLSLYSRSKSLDGF